MQTNLEKGGDHFTAPADSLSVVKPLFLGVVKTHMIEMQTWMDAFWRSRTHLGQHIRPFRRSQRSRG